jgi:hypothetical protein
VVGDASTCWDDRVLEASLAKKMEVNAEAAEYAEAAENNKRAATTFSKGRYRSFVSAFSAVSV